MVPAVRRLLIPAVASIVLFFTIESDPLRPGPSRSDLDRIYGDFDTLLTDLSAYAWPLKTGHATTSVFADFRETHFHAGVDISTRGQEGFKVYAMRDGYVSLVRVSSSGYGKALQITHEDGFTTWYAHLQRYAPDIDAAVKALQKRAGRYQVTLRPARTAFRVKQGDHIAYTGSTGAGGAHIHFEIRDQNGNPVNPLLSEPLAPRAKDDAHPIMEEVGFLPLKASTFIQGDTRPFYLRPIRKGKYEYALNTVVHVTGTLGMTLKVKDGVGPREYRNRGVALTFELDSTILYTSRIARIPSRESKQVALHYDWAAHGEGKSYHQKLFLDMGNRLPFYDRREHGAGVLRSMDVGRGYHSYRITATDVHGNSSVLTGTLVFNHPPAISVQPATGAILVRSAESGLSTIVLETTSDGTTITSRTEHPIGSLTQVDDTTWSVPYPERPYAAVNVTAENEFGTSSAGHWIPTDTRVVSNSSLTVQTSFYRDYAYVAVSSSLPMTGRPRIKVLSGPIESDLHVRSLTSKTFFSSFSLDLFGEYPIMVQAFADVNQTEDVEGHEIFTIHPITRENGGVVLSDDGTFRMVFPPGAVFTDTYVRLERTGDEFEVRPWDVLLDRGASVEMLVPAKLAGRRAGLFSQRGSGLGLIDWTTPGRKETLSGRVTRFLGSYVVLEDESGPEIGAISLGYSNDWLSGHFRLNDDRAGIDATSLRVTIDGTPVIPEYETEGNIARLREVIHLKKGSHTITVSVSDHMGNMSTRSARFTTK